MNVNPGHSNGGGYRVPLAYALSQPPGSPWTATNPIGYTISTMGTLNTGPANYVPTQWLNHEGHPGWQIPQITAILNKSLSTNPAKPDLITIHLGTNDCDAKTPTTEMEDRMNTLLAEILATTPTSQVFVADIIATGDGFNDCIVDFARSSVFVHRKFVCKGLESHVLP